MLKKIEIKYLSLDKLIPYSGNARTHSENQVDEIVRSIKKHGFTNPILLDSNNGIIAGHGRLLAARKLGLNEVPTIDFMPILFSTTKDNAAIYICGSHQNIHLWRVLVDNHFNYKNLIVWKKNNWSMGDLKGAYAGQHELIIFAHKGNVKLRGERHRDIWEFDRDPPKDHPTQKPVEMVEFALTNTSDTGNIILDLFGGSGSTLIACEKTNRQCFMMELSPQYCDVIIRIYSTKI